MAFQDQWVRRGIPDDVKDFSMFCGTFDGSTKRLPLLYFNRRGLEM